ncbi:hypothetical protein IFM89_039909 [Coptis chinensis]|uniref:DUF3752 domain-containing protein n=1 Tax=Coptis chinensis TaxID=261450 RepID=A0A835LCN4_9MAGN|nr:hypothetical protein IFM89_039909 [Coptis chinensis]
MLSSVQVLEAVTYGPSRQSALIHRPIEAFVKLSEGLKNCKIQIRLFSMMEKRRGVDRGPDYVMERQHGSGVGGISMEGDDELLAETKMPPKRDKWMTTLPPERKVSLASNEEKKRTSSDADLVDKYNITKRSKSLVEKHQEESANHRKRKSKQEKTKEKYLKEQKEEEWVGKHPWKPWDREKDLTAGRQNVNLDSENMVKGLSSRFSGGNVQRNFL